jgi:hypothetical protein
MYCETVAYARICHRDSHPVTWRRASIDNNHHVAGKDMCVGSFGFRRNKRQATTVQACACRHTLGLLCRRRLLHQFSQMSLIRWYTNIRIPDPSTHVHPARLQYYFITLHPNNVRLSCSTRMCTEGLERMGELKGTMLLKALSYVHAVSLMPYHGLALDEDKRIKTSLMTSVAA